jgi:hypothetical protein
MARSEVTVTKIDGYNSANTITKDAMDTTNNHSIDVEGLSDERLQIYFDVTTAPVTIGVKAGNYEDGVLGDLTITSTSAEVNVIEIETSRFKEDGLVLINLSSTGSGAGTIYATANVQAK